MAFFGFIGTGNMGGALAKAAAASLPAEEVCLSDRDGAKAQALADALGCKAAGIEQTAAESRYLFLGVKPHIMPELLKSIAPVLKSRKDRFVLVSMAAALAISDIREMAQDSYPVIRIMPNTPVSVGSGLIMYDATQDVTEQELADFCRGMAAGGRLDRIPEAIIDAGSAISGCGPAFVCLFAEALADGAVACGLPRTQAMEYAALTLLGTAKLLLESGEHPGALKDAVCSPGGTTIAGVRALEQGGFRAAAMNAVEAAFRRTKEMKK